MSDTDVKDDLNYDYQELKKNYVININNFLMAIDKVDSKCNVLFGKIL